MTKPGERLFFSGDSLEQALMSAARHYQCGPEELRYEQVKKRHGFLRTPRRVVLKIDPQNYRRAAGAAAPVVEGEREPAERPVRDRQPIPSFPDRHVEPRSPEAAESPAFAPAEEEGEDGWDVEDAEPEERNPPVAEKRSRIGRRPDEDVDSGPADVDLSPLEDRYPVAEGPAAQAARQRLEDLFELADLDLEAAVLLGEGRLEIDLSGPDAELLQEGEGQLLRAFQHLLPRMLQVTLGELVPCRIDSGNYQESREERLRSLAKRVASEVREEGQAQTLYPMSPADRRIVHLALADYPDVETESVGSGYYKRITVRTS